MRTRAQRTLDRAMSEDQLLDAILKAARTGSPKNGPWLAYHQRPAWTKKGVRTALSGNKGFPDLVLVRQGFGLIFAELKTETGPIGVEQARWLMELDFAAHDGEYSYRACLWRPRHLDEIIRFMTEPKEEHRYRVPGVISSTLEADGWRLIEDTDPEHHNYVAPR